MTQQNPKVQDLGTILSVWAHPDDETFSCAGVMAAAVQNGQRVVCVTATRGERGIQDPLRWPPEHLATIRSQELAKALDILGVSEHHFLDYPDGECESVPLADGAKMIRKFIDLVQPNSIITFAADGMTGHPDHKSVSTWVKAATDVMDNPPNIYYCVTLRDVYHNHMKELDKKFNIFFNLPEPYLVETSECSLCFECDEKLCRLKYQALRAMPSQTEAMLLSSSLESFKEFIKYESFSANDQA
jgi:LmbE family N-acetylglucosaminyl deacetylase